MRRALIRVATVRAVASLAGLCLLLIYASASAQAAPANKSCWSDTEARTEIESAMAREPFLDFVMQLSSIMASRRPAARYCSGLGQLEGYPLCTNDGELLKLYGQKAAVAKCLVPRRAEVYLTPQPPRTFDTEFYVLAVSAACFGVSMIAALLNGLTEIVLIFGRFLARRPLRADWWALLAVAWLPLLLVPVAMVLAFPALSIGGGSAAELAFLVALIAIGLGILLAFAAPLIQAYVVHRYAFWPYLQSVIAILAMPVAMYAMFAFAGQVANGAKSIGFETVPVTMFRIDDDSTLCTANLMGQLHLMRFRTIRVAQMWPDTVHTQFWVDTTLKAATLDAPEIFGCSLTQIRHNEDSTIMDVVVFFYRLFVSTIVLSAILLPVVVRLRRARLPA